MYIDVKRKALTLLSMLQEAETLERYHNMAATPQAKMAYLEKLQNVRGSLINQMNDLYPAFEAAVDNTREALKQGEAQLNPPLDPVQPDVQTGQPNTPPPSEPEATATKTRVRRK